MTLSIVAYCARACHARVGAKALLLGGVLATLCPLSACQPSDPPNRTSNSKTQAQDTLIGCYTVSHDEPAQIKISRNGTGYQMQMRRFNDPTQGWDNPEPLETLAPDNAELTRYFDIKADEQRYLQAVLARPDRVLVLAKITDSFARLNPQFDSSYLAYIYRGSNTIYHVACEGADIKTV